MEGRSEWNFVGTVLLAVFPLIVPAAWSGSIPVLLSLYELGLWLGWLFTAEIVRYGMPALACFTNY